MKARESGDINKENSSWVILDIPSMALSLITFKAVHLSDVMASCVVLCLALPMGCCPWGVALPMGCCPAHGVLPCPWGVGCLCSRHHLHPAPWPGHHRAPCTSLPGPIPAPGMLDSSQLSNRFSPLCPSVSSCFQFPLVSSCF